MPLEQQVCSLELAKELKELGYPQESLFVWAIPTHDQEWLEGGGKYYRLMYWEDFNQESKTMIAAPTVAELLERLPASTSLLKRTDEKTNSNPRYYAETFDVYKKDLWGENPANALAKLRICLLKNNLIEIN